MGCGCHDGMEAGGRGWLEGRGLGRQGGLVCPNWGRGALRCPWRSCWACWAALTRRCLCVPSPPYHGRCSRACDGPAPSDAAAPPPRQPPFRFFSAAPCSPAFPLPAPFVNCIDWYSCTCNSAVIASGTSFEGWEAGRPWRAAEAGSATVRKRQWALQKAPLPPRLRPDGLSALTSMREWVLDAQTPCPRRNSG